MSIVRRTRSAARQGLRLQRRVVLVQALFWPTVLGVGLALGAMTIAIRRSSKTDEPPRPAVNDVTADGVQPVRG